MEKLPNILYKYRNWKDEFHKNVLLKNELFLSYPKNFNHPFDCKIGVNHHLLNDEAKVETYVKNLFEKHNKAITERRIDIEAYLLHFRERIKDLDAFQKEYEELEFSAFSRFLGVLSMSKRWDSILMWSHYGDFHRGYCIGYNEAKLRNSGNFGGGGNVTYSNDFPIIDPNIEMETMEKSFLQTHYKAKDWEYEEEYRLIKMFSPYSNKEQSRLMHVKDDFIEEIILGISISEEDKNEILENAANRNFKVYQAEKVPYEFKLSRKIIS